MRKLPLLSLMLLGACSSTPPVVTYTVNNVTATEQSCHVKSILRVIEPNIASGLDTQRIAVMQGDDRMNYYTGVKWAAPVTEMFEHVLVDSFDRAKIFAAVGSDQENINADIEVLTDIRDYEVDNMTNGKIHIRIVAKLVGAKDRRVLATIPVEKIVTPDAYKTESIVAAFNSASADIAQEITAETAAALPKCKAGK